LLIEPYQRLWSSDGASPPSRVATWILLLLCAGFPLAFGLLPHNVVFPIVAAGIVIAALGIVLFFNVNSFVAYMIPLAFLNGNSHLHLALIGMLFVSFLAWRLRMGDISFHLPFPFLTLVILFIALNGLTRSVDLAMGRYFLIYTLLVPLFVFLVFYNLKPATTSIRTNLTIICFIAALLGWISLAVYIQGGFARQIVTWDYGAQNRAAGFFGLILPIALVSLIDSWKNKSFLMWLWIFLGLLAGLLTTQTRAVLFAVCFAVLYISWRDRRALKIMIPVFLLALIAMPSLIITRMAMLFGKSSEVDWSSFGRIQIWLNSIELIPQFFWFGMGIDSFREIYIARFPFTLISAIHAHSIYLRWFFDYGVFGVIGFTLLVFACIRRGHRAVAEVRDKNWSNETRLLLGINAGVICLMIAGLVDAYLSDIRVSLLFWILLSCQLILSKRVAELETGS